MKSIAETNPYLRDPVKREAALFRSALESSIFEGARGLRARHAPKSAPSKPRKIAASRKRAKRS